MKQLLPFILILIMIFGAFGGKGPEQTTTSVSEENLNLTLYADFSNGMPDARLREKELILPLENEPASRSQIALALAEGLSEWTGLDFTLNDVAFPDDESISVDWSKDSTLIAGWDDRESKEGFHFFDAVSLNWFMLDSLATTFKKNLELATVYYHSEGQPITFPNPEDMAQQGLPELPIDQPYEGSAFFLSHAGGKGEEDIYEDPDSDDYWVVNEPIAEGVIFAGSLLRSDPGENMTSYEAASGLYHFVLQDKLVKGTDYSQAEPMFITCVDIVNIDGAECYLLSVSGAFNTKAWEYAVDYDYSRQNVYLISEMGNQLLGSLPNPSGGDNADWMTNEVIAEGVIFAGSLLQSDPGENITPYEAASGLYSFALQDKLVKGTDYSQADPMFITCVDVVNIDGAECYLLSVSGAFNTKAWEYAVDYDYSRQNVYLISETGNQLLGSLLD